MTNIISCQLNINTVYLGPMLADGTRISINYTAVENEFADNMYQRSELDYRICNDLLGYGELILNGDPEQYLNEVTSYRQIGSEAWVLYDLIVIA